VNFVVFSLVLWFSAKKQELQEPKTLWKKHILPVWGMGFLCDMIGAILTFGIYLIYVEIPGLMDLMNPHLFPGATLIAIPGMVFAGWLIYILNKKLTFRKSELDPAVIHKLCLHLAIWTTPYTMLIPLYW